MSPEIAEAQILAREFSRILKQRDREAFPSWMERMSRSRIREMKSLASGLERDRAAVAAALGKPSADWFDILFDASNLLTEGSPFAKQTPRPLPILWLKLTPARKRTT